MVRLDGALEGVDDVVDDGLDRLIDWECDPLVITFISHETEILLENDHVEVVDELVLITTGEIDTSTFNVLIVDVVEVVDLIDEELMWIEMDVLTIRLW